MYDEPTLNLTETIPEADQTIVNIWFPHESWEPIFFPHEEYPEKFVIVNHPQTYLFYYRTQWDFGGPYQDRKWIFSLPSPNRGDISTGPQISDDNLKIFRNRISRILGRLKTNRLKHWDDYDQMVATKNARRFGTWAGHHALNWCRGGPRRMIDGLFRPCDDWSYSETEWYRSLKEKVIARFGEDYGGPRKFEPKPIKNWPRMLT